MAALLTRCSGVDRSPREHNAAVDVLIELHLADARQGLDYAPLPHARDSVLARYGLDATAFARLLDYYVDNPLAYAEVYEKVMDRLVEERHRQGEFPGILPPGLASE